MLIETDTDTGAVYFRFLDDGPIARTVDIPDTDTVMVDLGPDDELIGVEFAAPPRHEDFVAVFNMYPYLKDVFAALRLHPLPV